MAENEKWMDSIAGKSEQFSNKMQEFWKELLNSEVIKEFLDLGTSIVDFMNKIGPLPAIIGGVVLALSAFKKINLIHVFKDLGASVRSYAVAMQQVQQMQTLNLGVTQGGMLSAQAVNAYATAISGLSAQQQAAILTSNGLTQAQAAQILAQNGVADATIRQVLGLQALNTAKQAATTITGAEIMATMVDKEVKMSDAMTTWLVANATKELTRDEILKAAAMLQSKKTTEQEISVLIGLAGASNTASVGIKGVTAALWTMFKTNPVGWILSIVSTVMMAIPLIKSLTTSTEEAADEIVAKAQEIKSEFKSATDEYQKNIATVEGLEDEFTRLSACVDENGKNISLSTKDYERYREIVQSIVDISPEVVQGYDAEGNAIINKNELIKESIRLMQAEQKEAAKQYASYDNWKTLASAMETEITNAPDKDTVMANFASDFTDYILKDNVNFGDAIGLGGGSDSGYGGFNKLMAQIGIYDKWSSGAAEGWFDTPLIGVASTGLNNLVGLDKFYSKDVEENFSTIIEWLKKNEKDALEFFSDEQYKSLVSYYDSYIDAQNHEQIIQSFQEEYTDMLYNSAMASDDFYALDKQQQGFLKDFIEHAFPIPTNGDINAQLDEAKSKLEDMIGVFATDEVGDLLSQGYNLMNGLGVDGKSISLNEYEKATESFMSKLAKAVGYDQSVLAPMLDVFGLNQNRAYSKAVQDAYNHVDKLLKVNGGSALVKSILSDDDTKKFRDAISNAFTVDDLMLIKYHISAEPGSMTIKELRQALYDLKKDKGIGATKIKTFSAYTEDIETYNTAVAQTSEVVANNTEVTEEYKQSLIDLGVTKEDLDECFYEENNLLVKNASKLNNLVKEAKNGAAQNVKLARSQARLQYYELYKEINKLTDGVEVADEATLNYIDSLYDQMNILEKTIAKYSLFEAALLGASNAYTKLEEAQAADEAADYGSKAEELVNVLGNAINSRELGTEAAQVSIEGIVPASELENLETAEEKMDAIYKYFTTGTISQLFTIEFDDEGAISSVEMTEDNLKQYINSSDVFNGTWDNFTLNPAIQSMEDFMKATNMTKEMAFAFFAELEKYDISWLAGNYDTLMDQLMSGDLEYQLYKNTSELADIEVKIAHGTATQEDWDRYTQLNSDMSSMAQQAADHATVWLQTSGAITDVQSKMVKLNDELEKAKSEGDKYSGRSIDEIEADIKNAQTECNELYALMETLGEAPTEATLQPALDKVKNDIQKFKDDLKSKQEMDVITYDNGVQVFTPKDPAALYIEGVIEKIDDVGFEALGLERDANGNWVGLANIEGFSSLDKESQQEVIKYIDLLEDEHSLNILMGEGVMTIETHLENIVTILEKTYELMVGTKIDDEPVSSFLDWLDKTPFSKVVTFGAKVTDNFGKIVGKLFGGGGGGNSAGVNGTAYKSGSWGAQKTETALTGELGPEMLVRGNKWQLIGENGAEFTQIKRGDIIFNHKQTADLLKNGRVTGRGKAYANGTTKTSGSAYAFAIGTTESEDNKIKQGIRSVLSDVASGVATSAASIAQNLIGGVKPVASAITTAVTTAVDTWGNISANLADYYSGTKTGGDADSSDEFEEKFDWFEVKLEEISEELDLFAAQLENCATYTDKNAKIQQMMAANIEKQDWLGKGIKLYQDEADSYLSEIDSKYHDMVKNGFVDIELFAGEADEAQLEAIKNYRDYAQKAADLAQQLEETETELRQLAIDKIDNAEHSGAVRAAIEGAQTDKLQNAVDFDEARGLITDPQYYAAMMENSSKTVEYLTSARNAMQDAFDEAVRNGHLERGSDQWYAELEKLYDIDAQIDEATAELEEFQNAINDIYWEHFDQLVNQFDYISEDAHSLIDLMSSSDMVTKPNNENGWSEDDVKWTQEGLATLGLHAQEMERAEVRANAYAIAIDDLEAEYKAGHYSESEYLEKLNELTQGQYDAIQAAQDEKDAIVDLQKARIDEVKNGIEKQIDAYTELIEKRKEELDSEKDLYDFQRSTMEQQKNIADIERKLAALSNDNSMSAIAKRKQLEAELAEAQYELQDSYYNRSVEDKQTALDKELEAFQESKEAEMEQLDLWLENVEVVVAESLGIVMSNAEAIGQTLTDKATEYNLTVSDAILVPWKDSVDAIDAYTAKFGDSASQTTSQLANVQDAWQKVREAIYAANMEADKYYNKTAATADGPSVEDINTENANYAQAKKTDGQQQAATTPSSNSSSVVQNANQAKAAPSVGSTVTVKKTATNFSSKSGNAKMASFVPGGSYTVYQVSGDQILIGKSGVYTGWVKKSDLQGYARGTLGVNGDQFAWIDELGEELVMHADGSGKLAFLSKGSSVVPHDLTENLMALGQLDPSEVLDRNRPSVGISPDVHNTEINLSITYGDMVSIGEFHGDNLADLEKMVAKQFEKHTKDLNYALRRYTR